MNKKRKFFKSLLSMCLALALILSPVEMASAETKEINESETVDLSSMYRKYDLETGEVSLVSKTSSPVYRGRERVTSTQAYVPDLQMVNQEGERSVIGFDNRGKITTTTSSPYYAVARLDVTYTDGTSAAGTGFLVSSNVMLTAGHVCMSSNSNAPISSMTVYLGQNGSSTPTVAYLSSYYVCANFTYFNDDDQDDYAILVLSSNPGNTTGWFGLGYQNDTFFGNNDFIITGYPGDKPFGTMWKANGSVSECTTYVLKHSIDTYGGESGSPIYTSNNTAYGIQVAGYSTYNHGRRMTQEVFDWLVDNGFIS